MNSATNEYSSETTDVSEIAESLNGVSARIREENEKLREIANRLNEDMTRFKV